MLERKRLLKVKEQVVRDGQRVFIYEQPKTGDIFTIIDPRLQLNQLEAVQQDVAALLEHGLNLPPQQPQTADSTDSTAHSQENSSSLAALAVAGQPDGSAAEQNPGAEPTPKP